MSNDGAFVSDLVGDRFLLTFAIGLGTILLTWLVAIPIGVYSAVRQYSVGDYVLTILGFLGMCIPQFVSVSSGTGDLCQYYSREN